MERNDFSSEGSTPPQSGAGSGFGSSGGTGNVGNTGNTMGSQGYAAGTADSTDAPTSNPAGSQSHGFADRARDVAGTAQEKLADVGSSVRDRAGNLKDSLANALDTGAERLRRQGGTTGASGQQLAGVTEAGSVAIDATNSRLAPVATKVAGGMEATAGWLRETDLDSVKTGIERQVKEHPGRTLLVAVGLGYLLGKAIRK
jgi:ElaB/YqjD/DUF883 family membrane-anchored ribosome-binding protein